MLSRRQFLKRAAAAGVVAATIPSVLASVTTPTFALESTAQGLLSYKDLESTYQSLSLGYDEPDLIWVADVEHYRKMVQLVQRLNEGFASGKYRWETVSDAEV